MPSMEYEGPVTASKPDKRVTRLVYGAFVAVTTVFVGSLIVEVATQVFSDAPRSEALSAECAKGVRELYAGVDQGIPAGLAAEDVEEAVTRYRTARDEAWKKKDGITQTCAAEPRGADALAAVARLDRQAETVIRRQTVELRAVRREVDSFIRGSSK